MIQAQRGNGRNYSATHHECFARGPEPAQFKILHEMVYYAAVAVALVTTTTINSISAAIVSSTSFCEALRGMNHSSTGDVVRRCEGVLSISTFMFISPTFILNRRFPPWDTF